ncbi:glutamine synthetase family protein [Synergistes jonesii]|uniref:Glutamine synthetase n=1 Tax=Synergistes jonesii TaxID=2754 RepID=A0A073IU22_9BACT|nr:glutamine synthetase beta-grasp domain-containing protein [Synergistes jonesii]KEJ93045.1 glutamine synthetase [Synergistes jonesii]OFB60826.1 glutamine synthetase [Synergistes jonesii]OFB64677.1 glutamine synthetase [Synergistes jonesii]OFB65978.1 glutamine synthetase [Synergistes jonesii]OFB68837.1 glutamine synthetase [Synergistes jonesii]
MQLERYNGHIEEADYLNLLMVDIAGDIRSVALPKGYVSEKILKDGIGFDASNYGYAKVSDSDMVAVPDMSTAFFEIRGDYKMLHVLCDVVSADRETFDQYPRNVIKKARDFLREEGIADTAKLLVELEYYVFEEAEYKSGVEGAFYRVKSSEGLGEEFASSPRVSLRGAYHRMPPEDSYMDFRNETVKLMDVIGIPVKYHHHEVALSQLEIELDFMDMAQAADMVSLAKWIIRQVAAEWGLRVTFMPKPLYKMPGNGMHVHQFLEKGGSSIFPGDVLFNLSNEGLSYIAGMLSHSLTGSLLAFACPSTNSYRRLVHGYEAPVSATFAKGSRAAAVRIPGYVKKDETRVEYRTGDASCNLYFFLAAMVLAGADGILRGLNPVALGYQSREAREDLTFPLNLNAVLDGLEKDADYLAPAFPDKLIELWIKAKRAEAEYVYNAPTPQEYELYF